MAANNPESVSAALRAAADGNLEAARDLLPLVYQELKQVAKERLRHLPPGQTLQPTALVHEAYLKVVGDDDPGWNGQRHFFAAAARSMRQILVENARRKMAEKHGGGRARVDLDGAEPIFEPPSDEVLAVDEALADMEDRDPRKVQIVNFRYFARLTTQETAAALGISPATVRRDWRYMRAWLDRRLRERE